MVQKIQPLLPVIWLSDINIQMNFVVLGVSVMAHLQPILCVNVTSYTRNYYKHLLFYRELKAGGDN